MCLWAHGIVYVQETPLPPVIKNTNAQAYLHSVASQGGSTFKPPALLLGHHEQLSQALLHDAGKALVV